MTLSRSFYLGNTLAVARDLLGRELVCRTPEGEASGIVVETEAYGGLRDPASHAFGGRRTRRTEILYLPGGHAYIYLVYGLHLCLNLTTGEAEVPECVLIRALEPATGLDLMRERRSGVPTAKLASGPGRLCRALGIGPELNGADLTGDLLFVRRGRQVPEGEVAVSSRIGVEYAGEAHAWPWRFLLRGSPCLSRPP